MPPILDSSHPLGAHLAGIKYPHADILGGPGAVFWMLVVALVGMATGFIESTLAQMYKIRHPEGTFRGGPAYSQRRRGRTLRITSR